MAEPAPHGSNGRAGHGPDGGRGGDRRSQENTDALILMQARCLDQLLHVLPTLGGKQPRRLESTMNGEDRAMLQRVAAELLALAGDEEEEEEGEGRNTGGARKRHKGLSWASPGSSGTSMSLRGGRGQGLPQQGGRRARMRVAEEFEDGAGADGSLSEDGMSVFPDPIWQHVSRALSMCRILVKGSHPCLMPHAPVALLIPAPSDIEACCVVVPDLLVPAGQGPVPRHVHVIGLSCADPTLRPLLPPLEPTGS